jgi:KaiC/GvpD/RAD55 family RecA-like ATPase
MEPMSDMETPPPGEGSPPRCDFCGLPHPPSPVVDEIDGHVYTFCSTICRDAMATSDHPTGVYQGFRRFDPAVPVLEPQLPEGIPRNSMTLVSDEPGTRGDALLVELVWYTLQQGGSAVVVVYQEPPISVLDEFLRLRWNVIPYLETGQLHIVDCFTYRVKRTERMVDRFDRWNQHISDAAERVTRTVRDPTDLGSVQNKIDDCVESDGVRDGGILVIDSLTELGTLVHPVQAYDFVKDLRADITKGRFMPTFAHATFREDDDEFPHDLEYMMDGIVDLEVDDDPDGRAAVERIRVRKMRGVPTSPGWTVYEYDGDRGLVGIEPVVSPGETGGTAPR